MIDVEPKALKLIKTNKAELNSLLKNREYIKSIFSEVTQIDNWSVNIRIRLYYEISDLVLDEGIINSFYKALKNLDDLYEKEDDSDINIFYAVVIDFREFFKRVYEIYLLDQLYYILVNIPFENLWTVTEQREGFKTGSYYESVNFEFGFNQFSLLDNECAHYDRDLYNFKMLLRNQLLDLLENPNYQKKKDRLLEILTQNKNDNLYFSALISIIKSLKRDKSVKRALTKKPKDENQLFI